MSTPPTGPIGVSASPTGSTGGPLSSAYRWLSFGMCALVFLGAFEQLAVTTVMPIVADSLGGQQWFALAFAGPLAVSVVGLVVAGNWCDRSSPTAPLLVAVGLFVTGLVVAGTAPTMEALVVGRIVHGLGAGAMMVPLYVLVVRIYPADIRPRILAGFAAAWVLPALIGPALAGIVAETVGWRWVFLGVIALVVPALALMLPTLRDRSTDTSDGTRAAWSSSRIAWSLVVAVAVLALNISAELPQPLGVVAAVAALVVAVVGMRPLLPTGTLLARRGLPAVVGTRMLISSAFFGTEVYLPYLLMGEYKLSASLAGMALTGAGLAWAAASWLQGRLGSALTSASAIRIGTLLLVAAITASLVTSALHWSPLVAILGWLLAGAGMGLMFPRTTVLALEDSRPTTQGFNSAALGIADAVGPAVVLALTASIALAAGGDDRLAVSASFGLTLITALAAAVIGSRTRDGSPVG